MLDRLSDILRRKGMSPLTNDAIHPHLRASLSTQERKRAHDRASTAVGDAVASCRAAAVGAKQRSNYLILKKKKKKKKKLSRWSN